MTNGFNLDYINIALGVAIAIVGFLSTSAIAVIAYFIRKRDLVIDSHSETLKDHADRLIRVETGIAEVREDVREIKGDIKSMQKDISGIRETTGVMHSLLASLEDKLKS